MRRAAWWRDRADAVRATLPALSPPAASTDESTEVDEENVDGDVDLAEALPAAESVAEPPAQARALSALPVEAWGPELSAGCLRVSGEPAQGTATLVAGCDLVCAVCGVNIAGTLTVVAADEGWCVATLCGCPSPFYTQESGFYRSEQAAWDALDRGDYEPGA